MSKLMLRLALLGNLVALVTLGGCALQPPPSAAALQAQALPNTAVPPAWSAGVAVAQPMGDGWLAGFGDPSLPLLVGEALSHNADLQVAAARLEQATGYVKVASASLLPTLGVVGLGGGKSGSSGGLDGVFLNAALELDVWGRIRYGQAAAQQQQQALAADYAYARQSLAATVVKGWFLAVEAGQQRDIAWQALKAAEALQRVAEDRHRIGSGNEQAVAEARANVGSYRDRLRQVELGREQALRALELLLGRYPSAEVQVADRLAPAPVALSAGLPAELLERRPDVVAAERRVAAAFDRVGEARAAQLPRISLTAGVSSVSSDLLVLQNNGNPLWSVGGSLLAPLYQGGALRAQVEIRSAEQQQAVAEYARTAQRAFGEVENALAAEHALRERQDVLAGMVRDSERALQLAQVQYRVGNADMRAVEQSQLALYGARTNLLRAQSEQLAQRVNLVLALGGGFDAPPLAASAPQRVAVFPAPGTMPPHQPTP